MYERYAMLLKAAGLRSARLRAVSRGLAIVRGHLHTAFESVHSSGALGASAELNSGFHSYLGSEANREG